MVTWMRSPTPTQTNTHTECLSCFSLLTKSLSSSQPRPPAPITRMRTLSCRKGRICVWGESDGIQRRNESNSHQAKESSHTHSAKTLNTQQALLCPSPPLTQIVWTPNIPCPLLPQSHQRQAALCVTGACQCVPSGHPCSKDRRRRRGRKGKG